MSILSSTLDLTTALEEARTQYTASNPKSFAHHIQACEVLPGGNTRTSLFNYPFPLTIVRGEGSRLWDADGHEYADFLGEYTAGLFGHSHPVIHAAIKEALRGGIDLGGHSRLEAELAAIVCGRFSSIELVRFTNSGTEANLMAISAARAITKRSKVLVFDGAYHGSVLSFHGGSSPMNAPFDFVVAPYNDIDKTLALLERYAQDLAAAVVEPMLGIGGCIPADTAFLQVLREATLRHRIVLLFDEVMTSRLWPGGLQEMYGVQPDMTTLGKYIGGGMTCGAFGGRSSIMRRFDPRVAEGYSHAGTFNNNVITMSAGLAGMSLYTSEVARRHNARGNDLRNRLNALVRDQGISMQFTGTGSMMHIHACSQPVRNATDGAKVDAALRELIFLDLVAQGFWLGRHGMIVLSLPTTDLECDRFVASVEAVVERRRALLTA